MFALLRQYRDLLLTLVLVALPFVTYLTYAKRGRDLNAVDLAVLEATGPVERWVDRGVGTVVDAWGDYVALRQVREDNLRLQSEVFRLQSENLKLEEARLENERLHLALNFTQAQPAPMVMAPVIGAGVATHYVSVRIARGERDGLRKGMAVATATGIVGRIQATSAGYADVLLLADLNSKIAVEVQRTRARATVRGGGEGQPCKLEFAERSSLIDDGDILITSGTDGIFPKGLAVGRVTHLDRKQSGWHLSAEVTPAVDFGALEEVLVLTSPPVGTDVPSAQVDPALLKAAQQADGRAP